MRINTKFYSDGFYQLSTRVNGRIVSVIYSKDTHFDEAEKDFKEFIRRITSVPSPEDEQADK